MRRLLPLLLIAATAANAQTFRPEAIRAHMNFLASDLLEGRGTGTRGHQLAAEYVAAQFEAMGVAPGADGSYLQEIPFRRTTATSATLTLLREKGGRPEVLNYGTHFVTSGDPLHQERALEAGVVFAGFGISAPDQKYDDYAKIDARSRIVVIFNGAPKRFLSAVRAHYSSSLAKIENAARHGAAGLIFVSTPKDAARFSWDRVVRQSRLGAMHWLENDRTPHAVARTLSHTLSLGQNANAKLFGDRWAAVVESIERGAPKPYALPLRVKIDLVSRHERVTSPNVVGMIRGTDLADEYVVYSSHLDHLGITDPVDGDSINNGALDNASGIAALLEIARNFASGPKPRRSILFVATTAEEKGLRGADYFANNPPVPAGQLVANINIDQIFMPYAVKDVIALGAETNDLGDVARDVARDMKIGLSPDPFPEEVFFVRSDQYPFVRRGIPAIYIGPGFEAVAPNVSVKNAMSEWMRTRYHSPKDDLGQQLDHSVAAMLAEFDYRLGMAVANRDARPRWKPGDFFGETFGRK
jgi:hypothetical protein